MNQTTINKKELIRERLVALIECSYWLLIFEGSLRKWFLTFLSGPLFFVRDPFALWIYYLAWRHGFFPIKSRLFQLSMGIGVLFGLLGITQFMSGIAPPDTILFGLRMYFMYMPMAFVCGEVLTSQDLRRLCRRSLLVAIPMGALVFWQYRSPPSSWINRTFDTDSYTYGGIARTSGTFSFTQGHEFFALSIFVFAMVGWLLPKKHRPMPPWLLAAGTFAAAVNIILNGNRAILLQTALVYVMSLAYRFFCSDSTFSIRKLAPELLLCIGAVVYVTVFGTAFEAMSSRMSRTTDKESRIVSLIQGPYNAFTETLKARGLGIGIGAGTGGGRALQKNSMFQSRAPVLQQESENPRIIDECGILGIVFVAFRVGLVAYLGYASWRISTRIKNPMPLLLYSFVLLPLWDGQITFNGTSNGYTWLFVGFTMAALKLGSQRRSQAL